MTKTKNVTISLIRNSACNVKICLAASILSSLRRNIGKGDSKEMREEGQNYCCSGSYFRGEFNSDCGEKAILEGRCRKTLRELLNHHNQKGML